MDIDYTFLDNPQFDKAIIGETTDGNIVYSYALMIECLLEQQIVADDIEAIDYIDSDVLRAIPYMPNAPIILWDLNNDELFEIIIERGNL